MKPARLELMLPATMVGRFQKELSRTVGVPRAYQLEDSVVYMEGMTQTSSHRLTFLLTEPSQEDLLLGVVAAVKPRGVAVRIFKHTVDTKLI